ncbi:MAG: hypothetical protein ACKOFG_11150 [Limnohabitans sp.]
MHTTAILLGLALLGSTAWAESGKRQPSPAGPNAHKPQPPKAQTAKASAPKVSGPKTPARPAAEVPMGELELDIAQRVHQGRLPCELGASVQIESDQQQPGYFHVQGKGFRYRMHPVATSTGAIRLEDRQAGAVWLQLANKSMLMDQKKGQRLADECAHPEQLAHAEHMKNNPPPPLIEVNPGR